MPSEPYRYWSREPTRTSSELIEVGDQVVDPQTGEVLATFVFVQMTVEV